MAKRKFLMFLLLLLPMLNLMAQKEHFVYLQTENLQPFYVVLNGRNISSTAAGYLILPKLTDGVYAIKLGLAGSTEVQDYGISIAGQNKGYVVKRTENTGWAIQDLQTKEVQQSMEWSSAMATEQARQKALELEKQVQDSLAFAQQKKLMEDSMALAQKNVVVEDSASSKPTDASPVIVSPVEPVVNQPKADTAITVKNNDQPKLVEIKEKNNIDAGNSSDTATTSPPALTEKLESKQKESQPPIQPAAPKVIVEPIKSTAKELVFLDMAFGMLPDSLHQPIVKTDTAKTEVKIPIVAADSVETKITPKVEEADTVVQTKELVVTDTLVKPVEKADTAAIVVVENTKPSRQPCASLLSREDVETLITKASSNTDIEAKLKVYANAFSNSCVNTTNLKKICGSLASDVSKYRLLELAYPFTIDYYAYPELTSLFTDGYYLSKFKSLIQH